MVRTKTVHCVLVGKQQGKNHAGRLSVDGAIILKWTFSGISLQQRVKGRLWKETCTLRREAVGVNAPHNSQAPHTKDPMNN
jgi:hypothetical protein